MTILLNGKSVQLPSEVTSIQDLLTHYQLENRIVIVEQNKDIVYKEQYSSSMLSDKDKIEIIHFVGGG
ncbi:sulfur carrier protein ThiS [Bacillus sp. RG28]|uniref:Sulfur carrier protein ThiS n=1 Tax=Gottfriedia endophytica TaxID=2820819 RepID=A0A940NNZ5_9BACI|nr:sulfur carrier protein ThiS [Gottfriedia endophytica]MBP0726126.1 sulfur carrier protein ThiS [Gottfriedia endophytica]